MVPGTGGNGGDSRGGWFSMVFKALRLSETVSIERGQRRLRPQPCSTPGLRGQEEEDEEVKLRRHAQEERREASGHSVLNAKRGKYVRGGGAIRKDDGSDIT